jgi:hypothetical protein
MMAPSDWQAKSNYRGVLNRSVVQRLYGELLSLIASGVEKKVILEKNGIRVRLQMNR